jgi:hypothetical protein
MVADENRGEGTGQGNMRKLGYINEKFLDGSIYSKLLAESTGM